MISNSLDTKRVCALMAAYQNTDALTGRALDEVEQ